LMEEQPKKANPAKDFLKLSYPAHEKTPFLANCIEIRETKKYGRGMYTTQDLKPGDIISNSGPVLKSILKNGVYKQCTNCLEVNDMNLFPCPSCVTTMFCSKKCQDEAMMKFHKLECPHIDKFRVDVSTVTEAKATTWRSLLATQQVVGGFKNLKALCDDEQLTKKTFFDYDLSKDCKDLALNEFLSALGHLSAFRKYNNCLLPECGYEIFVNLKPIRSIWKSQKEKQDIKSILRQTMPIFFFPFNESFDESSMNESDWENTATRRNGKFNASGLHLPFIYFNSSCSPNIILILINSRTFHVVIKPIKKDEQLFETYS